MLEKGKIISSALRTMGEIKEYNNDNYEIYKNAKLMLEEVILEMSVSQYLNSNLDYRTLNKTQNEVDEEGRFIYEIPEDTISIVRAKDGVDFEEVGETIRSYSDTLTVLINRKIRFEEYKELYFSLFKWKLCVKLCEAYAQYEKKTSYILQMLALEENKLSLIEFPKTNSYIKKDSFGRGVKWGEE